MFNFFRKKSKRAITYSFAALQAYEHKYKYFYKVATWNVLGKGQIAVADPNAPRMITLDPWPQIVFLEADGKRTVAEFVNYMASEYDGPPPDKLDETIIYQVNSLLEFRIIALSDTPVELNKLFNKPVSKQG
jgi:hypothetical protein